MTKEQQKAAPSPISEDDVLRRLMAMPPDPKRTRLKKALKKKPAK